MNKNNVFDGSLYGFYQIYYVTLKKRFFHVYVTSVQLIPRPNAATRATRRHTCNADTMQINFIFSVMSQQQLRWNQALREDSKNNSTNAAYSNTRPLLEIMSFLHLSLNIDHWQAIEGNCWVDIIEIQSFSTGGTNSNPSCLTANVLKRLTSVWQNRLYLYLGMSVVTVHVRSVSTCRGSKNSVLVDCDVQIW